MNEPVRHGAEYEDRNRKRSDVLLILDVSVHCHKDVVPLGSTPQQLAIANAGPPEAGYRINLVARQLSREIDRDVLVK
jgi:hypothetical protein